MYNAYMSAPSGRVLDYLLNTPHFTSRQGRQKVIDAIAALYRPMAEEARGEMSSSEVQEVAPENAVESQEESPSTPSLNLEARVVMDGNDLGELWVLYDDEETFNDMAA